MRAKSMEEISGKWVVNFHRTGVRFFTNGYKTSMPPFRIGENKDQLRNWFEQNGVGSYEMLDLTRVAFDNHEDALLCLVNFA